MPYDRRKMRILKIFDPPKSQSGQRLASQAMLLRAKKAVVKELTRQERLGRLTKNPSRLEQAFLDASQENRLAFDYDRMRALVTKAAFRKDGRRSGFEQYDYAFNDSTRIIVNGSVPLVEKQLRSILMHECLHNTVERDGKPGNPTLSEDIEHLAMALLGDRDEQKDYFKQRIRVKCNSQLTLDRKRKMGLDPKFKRGWRLKESFLNLKFKRDKRSKGRKRKQQ